MLASDVTTAEAIRAKQLSSLEQKSADIVVLNKAAVDTEDILRGLQKERKYLKSEIKDENPKRYISKSVKTHQYIIYVNV